METETNDQCAKYGYSGWLLANDFRSTYGLPASRLAGASWDFVSFLREKKQNATAREEHEKEGGTHLT
jgi:hypothetical protein